MEDLEVLSNSLFKTFARCEYALKAAGYHKGEGAAEPDWTTFAGSIRKVLESPKDAKLKAAIAYMLEKPPKKQMVRNGLLEWSERKPGAESQADLILLYVRRVRNNLFHGGKFNGHWFEPQRSKELLEYSLVILEASVNGHEKVGAAYHQH